MTSRFQSIVLHQINSSVLQDDPPKSPTVIDNLEFFIQQVHQSGQADQLSDHPFTQSILQQIQAAGQPAVLGVGDRIAVVSQAEKR
jgi:hypothetical protein